MICPKCGSKVGVAVIQGDLEICLSTEHPQLMELPHFEILWVTCKKCGARLDGLEGELSGLEDKLNALLKLRLDVFAILNRGSNDESNNTKDKCVSRS